MSAEQPDEPAGLPLGRVRRLMKDAPHVRAVTQEASLLVAKAAELFLESFAARALQCKTGDGKLGFSDLGARRATRDAQPGPLLSAARRSAAAVASTERLDFLGDVVPRKRAAGEVLASLGRQPADDAART